MVHPEGLFAPSLRLTAPRPACGCPNSLPANLIELPTPIGARESVAFRNPKLERGHWPLSNLVRPERFELPTPWFVARYSIQLSYGRVDAELYLKIPSGMAEREGFEPSIRFWHIHP